MDSGNPLETEKKLFLERLRLKDGLNVAILIITVLLVFLNVNFELPLILLVGILGILIGKLIWKEKVSIQVLNSGDFILCAFLILGFWSSAISSFPANGPPYHQNIWIIIALSLCFRIFIENLMTLRLFLGMIVLLLLGAVLSGLFEYFIFSVRAQFLGWDNLSEIKFLFSPFGLMTNHWATLSVCSLSFPIMFAFLMQRSKILTGIGLIGFVLANFAVLISFSRGAYLSLILFWVVTVALLGYFKLVRLRKVVVFAFASLFLLALLVIQNPKPYLSTFTLHSTESQKRSTEGRLNAMSADLCKIMENPILGAGGNNYPLVDSDCISNGIDGSRTVFSNNLYLEILIENGFIGICLFLLFLIFILFHFSKRIRNVRNHELRGVLVFALAGMLALCFRELFFSTLFYRQDTLVFFAFFISVPFILNQKKSKNNIVTSIYFALILLSGIYILYSTTQIDKFNENLSNIGTGVLDNSVTQYSNKKFPGYANFIIGNYLTSIDDRETVFSEDKKVKLARLNYIKSIEGYPGNKQYLLNFISVNRPDSQLILLSKFDEIKDLSSEHAAQVAYLYFELGERRKAHDYLVKAILRNPEIVGSNWMIKLEKGQLISKDDLLIEVVNKYSEFLDGSESPILKARLARVLLELDSVAEAEDLLKEAIEILPNLSRPYCYLGQISYEKGDTKNSLKFLNQSLFLDNKDYLSQKAMGDYYFETAGRDGKKLNWAIQYYKEALKAWLSVESMNSMMSGMIFYEYPGPSNDLFNSQFLLDLRQDIGFELLNKRLSDLYRQKGDSVRSDYYERLSKRPVSNVQPEDIY